ncbi:hypothetical protein VE02_10313, partial [Pseudogymnoascus sp. 03VT05]
MVLAPPFRDAFDFLVDLKSYLDVVFAGCVAVGVFIIRRQRKRINAERPEFKTYLAACSVYYWVWTHFLLRRGNYAIRQTVIVLDSGAQTHKLNKVPNSELAEWDAKHDVVT